jgi:hypothetical protein
VAFFETTKLYFVVCDIKIRNTPIFNFGKVEVHVVGIENMTKHEKRKESTFRLIQACRLLEPKKNEKIDSMITILLKIEERECVCVMK